MQKKLLELRKSEILQGKFKTKKQNVIPTFAEFSKEYIEYAKGNKKSWDRDMYAIRKLLPYFDNKKLTEISPILIEKYKLSRKQVVATQTINKDLSILRRIFNIAISWNIVDSNPVDRVKFFPESQPREKILSHDDGIKLLNESPDHLKPIVTTALNTGMRYREILALKWQDVDLETGYINILKSKTGKGRKIPINDSLENCLKSLKSRYFVSESVSTSQSDSKKSNDPDDLVGRHAVLRGCAFGRAGSTPAFGTIY